MENASKALIIAGAILISILLISLGIVMFNASKGTTDKAQETSNVMSQGAEAGINSIQQSLGL
jgi:flagellar basal body-associated protein FliL